VSAFRRRCGAIGLLLCLGGQVVSCGRTRAGGETGSETHWLVGCETTADCRVGQCLCGVCTEPCRVALDCPAPLDVCSEAPPAQRDGCETAICTSSAPGEIEATLEGVQRVDACSAGRATSLVLLAGRPTAMSVFGNGSLGFVVADFLDRLQRVSIAGRPGDAAAQPSELLPTISRFLPLANGSALLAGSVADFDGFHGWVAQVDANWSLQWERQLDPTPAAATDVVALPDGGAVVLSFLEENQPDGTEKAFEAVWTRISSTGAVLWQRQESFQGSAYGVAWGTDALALTDTLELRIAVTTKDGGRVIFGSLDGDKEVRALEVDLTTFAHVVALPEGRFALVSDDSHVAVLDAAGGLVWQRDYANKTGEFEQNYTHGLAFNVARQELVLVGGGGNSRDGSWMQALDLDGNPTWELSLLPQVWPGEGNPPLSSGHGPRLSDVAVGPDGSLLATGTPGDFVYLWVGGGSCD